MKSFIAFIALAFCFNTIHSAAVSNECPLTSVIANWNNTITTCANQVVGTGGSQQLVDSVTELVHCFFNQGNVSTDNWSVSSDEVTDDAVSKAFQAYFCVLQNVIMQSPELGVTAWDCVRQVPTNMTDQCQIYNYITMCFEQQLKSDCPAENSRKRRSILAAVHRM